MQIKGETSVNKLIMLFVFDKMDCALSERIIIDICSSSNDWINYMDCVSLIQKLTKDGFIYLQNDGDDPLYSITTEGRESLANFYINIPKSVREEISTFIRQNKERYRTKQLCRADYYQNRDGRYTVYLRILEDGQSRLELKFVVDSRKTAQSIYKKWEDKAGDLYTAISENLID